MTNSPDTALLDRALSAREPQDRRAAFVAMLDSDDWRMVLAPHIVSSQGYSVRDTLYPDWSTFHQAAVVISKNDEKVQRSLELAGCRFSDSLLSALAKQMGAGLVQPAIEHLRNADGPRCAMLQRTLQQADDDWIRHDQAKSVIKRLLRTHDASRIDLMQALAKRQHLHAFVEVLHEFPPSMVEEWSALGQAKLDDPWLFDMAMATLPHVPAPLLYLMRLEPLRPTVMQRVMASARADWVATALEIAILDGLDNPALVPLAEIGVRLGGRSLAAATAWIGASKLAKKLLIQLGTAMSTGEDQAQIRDLLWIRRSGSSADRALEQGRRGENPDLLDAAALIRQLRGDRVLEIVNEILREPRESMVESVLHPLCAINEEAAREVMALCESSDSAVADRAKKAREWSDIIWPIDDSTQRIEYP